MVRRRHITSVDVLLQYGYSPYEAQLVIEGVHDNCFTHEEFVQAIEGIGIPKVDQIHVDLAS